MKFTCELCSGKIVNGRCVDCGMDYSRRKNRYHLNENCDDYDKTAHYLNQSFEKTLITSEEKEKKNASWLKKTADAGQELKRMSRNLSSAGTTGRSAKTRNAKKKNGKLVAIGIIAGIFFFTNVLEFLVDEGIEKGVESVFDDEEDEPDVEILTEDDGDEAEDEEIFDQEADFEDGLACDFIFGQGQYIVGEDLPAGEYTLSNQSEYWCSVYLETLDHYSMDGFDLTPQGQDDSIWENIALKDDMIVRIEAPTSILFSTQNAQISEADLDSVGRLQYYEDSAQTLKIDHKWIVGDDIDAGRYAIRYTVEKTGCVFMYIYDENDDYAWGTGLANYSDDEAQWFYGLDLQPGYSVVFDTSSGGDPDMTVTLYEVTAALE